MKKILIVDDLDTNRELLKKMLVRIGDYEFAEAADGSEALAQYENAIPDLILMDINMPNMDGYQAASAIKSIMGDDYTPIIFITAMSSDSHLQEALASGGDDFISKPFNFEVLRSKVNAHFRIRELNQQLNEKNNQLSILNQRLTHDQDLIEHFFERALANSFLDPSIIQYHMSAMSAFAGDIFLVERAPEGGLYLLLGDFTGHGLSAAMGTLPAAMIFFKMTGKGATINEIAREINFQLNTLMPPEMFFAAILLKLEPDGQNLDVWMGGLPDCYWLGRQGEMKALLESKHLALGILDDDKFDSDSERFKLDIEDKIYLSSDGLIESTSPEGDMFGEERLKKLLLERTEQRFGNVVDELQTFTGTSDQSDDITFVELTVRNIPAQEQ